MATRMRAQVLAARVATRHLDAQGAALEVLLAQAHLSKDSAHTDPAEGAEGESGPRKPLTCPSSAVIATCGFPRLLH